METFGERITIALEATRQRRKDLAAKLNISTAAVGNLINNQIKSPRFLDIAVALGVDPVWLQHGTGEMFTKNPSHADLPNSQNVAQDEKHEIEYLDVRAAAGLSGFDNSDYPEVISRLYLSDDGMLDLVGRKSANGICIINVPTDSMEPTIRKGDIVFLDTNVDHYTGDGVYAFSLNGALFIKRIQKLAAGGYRLISDNETYLPEIISEEKYENAKFVGRFIRTLHIEAVNL